MSISSTTRRNNYTGNGATATYSYGFKIFASTDLLVTKNISGVESTLALSTDYTVSGVGSSSGGSITLVAGVLTSGHKITIRRVRPLVQSTDIRNQGDFYPEVHEDSFDNATMVDGQQQDEIDRSVKLPETLDVADFDMNLPTAIIGSISTVIGTNATGDGFEIGPTFTEVANAQSYAIAAYASELAALNSANAADVSADDATASAAAAAADLVLTNADVVLTHADVVLTNADVISSAASASTATTQASTATTQAGISTAQAVISTAQAVISTDQAVIATAQAVIATAAAASSADSFINALIFG